jgi:hypothetical protein
MASKGAKDIHTAGHTRTDIGHRPNRGQWVGIKKSEGSFRYSPQYTRIIDGTHHQTQLRAHPPAIQVRPIDEFSRLSGRSATFSTSSLGTAVLYVDIEREIKPCFSLELSHIQFINYSIW